MDSDGNPTNYIDYNIIVNAKGDNLSTATDNITLEDSMSRKDVWGETKATADLDLTNVRVYHYDPTKTNGIGDPLDNDLYTIQYDDSDSTGKRVTSMVLPDEVPLIVTYTYKINRESDLSKTTFDNSISLNGLLVRGKRVPNEKKEMRIAEEDALKIDYTPLYIGILGLVIVGWCVRELRRRHKARKKNRSVK